MTWRDKYLNEVVCGDALALLPELPAGCVHQCVINCVGEDGKGGRAL